MIRVLPIRIVESSVLSVDPSSERNRTCFLSDEGPMLETLDYILSVAVHRPFYIWSYVTTLFNRPFRNIDCAWHLSRDKFCSVIRWGWNQSGFAISKSFYVCMASVRTVIAHWMLTMMTIEIVICCIHPKIKFLKPENI